MEKIELLLTNYTYLNHTTMNLLFVLLGCSVSYLLNNRITTAVQFAREFNTSQLDWFLSGGIKNPLEETVTEAEKMATQISQYERTYNITINNWNYIYDTIATNTAENFIMVNKYLSDTSLNYSKVYVITSAFHHFRASKIAEQIIKDTELHWILGDAELEDSRYWEQIHIKNVDADIKKAVDKFIH
jgi:uncharacterized SAM-binding protein YcdF (DUF218 family)